MERKSLNKGFSKKSIGAASNQPLHRASSRKLHMGQQLQVNNARRPKVVRHATQLDMLNKLKRMAPFDAAAEHEFLVNMYKLRGSYISEGGGLATGRQSSGFNSYIESIGEERRGSVSEKIFEKISAGVKVKVDGQRSNIVPSTKKNNIVTTREGYRYVFLPADIARWESFVAMLVSIQMLLLPYLVSFDVNLGETFQMVEFVVDIVFCVDLVLQFNVAYEIFGLEGLGSVSIEHRTMGVDATKFYETRRRMISMNYLRGWFFVDFIAIIPLLLKSQTELSLTKTLRLPRLFRLLKVARVFRSLKSNSKLRRFLLYSKYTSAFRLIGLIVGIFVFNHFLACIWWAVAKESIEETKLENDSSSSYFTAYSQSVLLMMGERLDLTTNASKIFSIIIIIFTSIFVAVLFGEVAMLVTSFNANSQKYQTKMTELYEAMDTMGLPATLQERVLQFYDFLWLKHHSLDGKIAMASFFDELSPNLSKEIHMCMYKEMLLNVGFFREFTADVIHHLVMSLETKIFMPRDYVISVGECGTDMFFIDYGKAEVFLKHTHVKTLKKNDYFGEIALITDVRRTASVQASSFLQVVCLKREDFEACAEDMTVEGRQRVLAHILKQYYGKDILQRCSEPDFVYENSESQGADIDDETMDMFSDEFDPLHPHIAAEEEEIAGMMDSDLATIQRIELVENHVENINNKLDKLVNLTIKAMASSDMWKMRGAHDEATKGLSVQKELEGAPGRVVMGESSGLGLGGDEALRKRLQTAPDEGGGGDESEGSMSPEARMLRKTVSGGTSS